MIPPDRMAATFLVSLLVTMTPMVLDCAGLFRPQMREWVSWAIVTAASLLLILYLVLSSLCLRWDVTASICTVWS